MHNTNNKQWPGWETVRFIGEGSFGSVYEIRRQMPGHTEKAALKVISIPHQKSDIEEMYSDGYNEAGIRRKLQDQLRTITDEYALMRSLSDCPNVVHCDDMRYEQHEDGLGYDVYIRMELLTPLTKVLQDSIPEETIVRLAKDLCTALIECGKLDILHRDVKPQNILVSPRGDFKLGDFGIAKIMETAMGGTRIGTYKYMAPEVYNNQPYGASADICSLGLVLYWMLNERRMPFLPLPPAMIGAGDEEAACSRRFSGEAIPAPKNGSERLKKIVLKACAFDPKERFASAAEMLEALNDIALPHPDAPADTRVPITEDSDLDATCRVIPLRRSDAPSEKPAPPQPLPPDKRVQDRDPREEKSEKQRVQPAPRQQKHRKRPVLIVAAAAALLALLLTIFFCCKLLASPGDAEHTLSLAEFDGRCYYIFDEPLESYEDAAAFCKELGGHLADVNSAEENRFLYEYLSSMGYDHVFLGGSDCLEDGVWNWESGAPFDYQNWNEGEPNNDLGGEDHLAMYRALSDWSWNDITYSAPSCQISAAAVDGAEASSYCTDPQKNCSADHLIDGDPATAWCCAESDIGIGESVTFAFSKKERLTGLTIHTGNQAVEGSLRPSTIRLICDDGSQHTFELKDEGGEQYIPFANVMITSTVKLVFDSAFDADHSGSITVSEVQFQAENRKTGFLCEWSDAEAASAAVSRLEADAPPETTLPNEPVETLPFQAEFTDWADTLPDHVTAADYVIEEQTLYSTQKLEKTTSTESDTMEGWTLTETISNLGDYGPWSEWSKEPVSMSDIRNVENETRYRYKTRETTTSSVSSKRGWELYDTTYSFGDYGVWSDWTATAVSSDSGREVKTKIQYKYRDSETTTSYSESLSGYTQVGSTWEKASSGTIKYAPSMPGGFSTSHSLYAEYHNTPKSAAETNTEKTVIDSDSHYGYLYFHWCRGTYSAGPINRKCSPYRNGEFAAFHAFFSTTSPSSLTPSGDGDGSRRYDNGSCCKDTYWYYSAPVNKQTYTTYKKLFTYQKWSNWSDWSDTAVSSGSSREVETRTLYRYRDRSQIPTYHFYRWSEWSDWSKNAVSQNSSRKVETEVYYRYQDKITETTYCFERWTDWSDYSAEPATATDELKVQTKKQYRYRSKTAQELRNPFTDLQTDASNFDAVMWVSENGIMTGTSESAFSPNGTITRGQMAMILWRAAGKPAPKTADCPFSDIPAGSPFLDAVLWATENGIAGGESAERFGIDSVCTRGQAITFLYRAAGKPQVVLSQEPFADVNAGDFFYTPVLWAYENNISSGISTTEFGVNTGCTRMQAAVMLYRAFAKE